MACSAIDDGVVCNVFAIVDHDGPQVDENEEEDVGGFLKREEKGKDVVRKALSVTIQRVESVGSKGSGRNPLVVRLVQALVDQWVVQVSVDPVDAVVREADEQRILKEVVP